MGIQGLLNDSNSVLFNLLPGPGTARSGMDGTSKAINQLVSRGSNVLFTQEKGRASNRRLVLKNTHFGVVAIFYSLLVGYQS